MIGDRRSWYHTDTRTGVDGSENTIMTTILYGGTKTIDVDLISARANSHTKDTWVDIAVYEGLVVDGLVTWDELVDEEEDSLK